MVATLISGIMLVVSAIAPAGLGALPTASAACPDVEVVFARRVGEPPGIGAVGSAFVESLRSRVAPRSVSAYGVNYPANRNFLNIGSGVADASARVQYVAGTCPDTRMVLGGFSQGAAVIDGVTATPVGIPARSSAGPGIRRSCCGRCRFRQPVDRFGGPITALSPLYGYKAIDLCNGNDPICSEGRDVSAHSLYVQSGMASQAASFVASRV